MASPFNAASSRFKAFCYTNNEIPAPCSFDTRSDRIPDDVDTILSRTNDNHTSGGDLKLQCCCGRSECIYWEHNNTLLGGIERDLETAARLGQALLTRHESYVTESQLEHERLTAYINELENERTSLQTTNQRIEVENRELRSQLDAANTSLKDSDNHVKSLEALLRDSESEIRRLNGLTRRAEELELKMLEMERDHVTLSRKADDSGEETRNTIRRWKESELRVKQLESDIQRIEWGTKQEKERFEGLVARLERERVLERELGGAEGRLKGAAALQGLKRGASGTNVVSHFVRDILQDNATLQAGIAELRELLQTSNDEVQNLREQILEHQPVEFDESQEGTRSRPLSEQLGWSQPSPKQVQQEVHVHHHYHAKLAGKRDRTPTIRKSARRRAVMGIGMLPATPESSTPSTPLSGPQRVVSSPILPIALHLPRARRARWSLQSAATTSSLLSSFPSPPQSYFEQSSSIFDRTEVGEESSRPTSPESAAGFSGSAFAARCQEPDNEAPLTDLIEDEQETRQGRSEGSETQASSYLGEEPFSESEELDTTESEFHDLTPKPSQILIPGAQPNGYIEPEPPDRAPLEVSMAGSVSGTPASPLIPVREAEAVALDSHDKQTPTSAVLTPQPAYGFGSMHEVAIQPRLRRTGSHDSLVSISGMDIHIAKRPTTSTSSSSSLLKGNKAYFAMSPSVTRSFSATPLATVTEFTALSSTRSFGTNSPTWADTAAHRPHSSDRNTSVSVELLSGLAGLPASTSTTQQRQASSGGLGRLVGSWVRGKWGVAPVKSSEDVRPSTSTTTSSSSSSSADQHPQAPFQLPGGRTPGINQKGAIPGFKPIRSQPPTRVQVKMMDVEGLKELLGE